ncbi:MAG: hypothetical protein M1830_000269 [Pleopsidium flavum]|nr:MAG: hypothetical protein M1830_000269 [Pleopsidium flavum]
MAQSAPPAVTSRNPFDDTNAVGGTTASGNTLDGQVSVENNGGAEPTGAWSRVWYYIFNKIFMVLKPAHNVSRHYPRYRNTFLAVIAASCCSSVIALGVTATLAFVPLVLFIAAIACSFVSLGAMIYLTMPLCIATYVAVLAVVLVGNTKSQHHTAFLVVVVLWFTLLPLISVVAWTFGTWGRAMFKGWTRQQRRQRQRSLPSIQLHHLPRTPLPVVLHDHRHLGAAAATIQGHEKFESPTLFSVGDDGFEEVREFV